MGCSWCDRSEGNGGGEASDEGRRERVRGAHLTKSSPAAQSLSSSPAFIDSPSPSVAASSAPAGPVIESCKVSQRERAKSERMLSADEQK